MWAGGGQLPWVCDCCRGRVTRSEVGQKPFGAGVGVPAGAAVPPPFRQACTGEGGSKIRAERHFALEGCPPLTCAWVVF